MASTFSQPESRPGLSRAERRAQGAYYTPPELVELVLKLTMPALKSGAGKRGVLRIVDPACGAGEFLLGAWQWLTARGQRAQLLGVDIDPAAASAARQRLQAAGATAEVRVGDALERGVLRETSFDVVVGNPPYLSIRELARSRTAQEVNRLRSHYRTARGNFDLYAVFIERAIELLAPGGRCGFVVPNKWATMDYARACRELLLSQTAVEQVVDLADCKAFAGASVYPQVLVFRKAKPSGRQVLQFSRFASSQRRAVRQSALSATAFQFGEALDVESRATVQPLGEVATISCGTAGYSAGRVAARLVDPLPASAVPAQYKHFITSGCIQRYAIRLDGARYLKRDYRYPRLPLEAPELTEAKRRMVLATKIVVAGMSRRLEAAMDRRGLALGVQVYAVYGAKIDLYYLLGVLNSKLLTYLFATRYSGKRLGGGYFAINKGQLAGLPIRVMGAVERSDVKRQRRISELAWLAGQNTVGVDAELDGLVYELFRLSSREIGRVEKHFSRAAAA
jgi:tRNA1(Val) A37 N6-methylase TrmN6